MTDAQCTLAWLGTLDRFDLAFHTAEVQVLLTSELALNVGIWNRFLCWVSARFKRVQTARPHLITIFGRIPVEGRRLKAKSE